MDNLEWLLFLTFQNLETSWNFQRWKSEKCKQKYPEIK